MGSYSEADIEEAVRDVLDGIVANGRTIEYGDVLDRQPGALDPLDVASAVLDALRARGESR